MRFWDTSALVPLLVEEPETVERRRQLEADREIAVWYATLTEIESAINRGRRAGTLEAANERRARARLEIFAYGWVEVGPTVALRDRALRLLRLHPLRAADAFQLAAALSACREQTRGFHFLCSDRRLSEAAAAEGFATA